MSIKLLDDEPSVHDEFGAHARIAAAIKETVETNDGGKVIALIGDWGSGKSTTISLLQSKLETTDVGIFTYDTWVHSGDHLRKSFLNELVDFLLTNKQLKDVEKWYQKKEELAGRLRITEKSVDQKLTSQAKWLLPIIFLLPIATTIISTLGPGYVQDQYFFSHYPFYLFAFTFAASIVLFAPVFYLIWFWFIKGQPDEVLSVIANKAMHKEKTTSIESPEATTIEFQELFREVMKDAFKESRKKLIIVLDNLDRLDDSEAKTVWSLLRGFIDNPNYRKNSEDKWIKNLWVIVPWAGVSPKENLNLLSNFKEDESKAHIVRDSLFLEKVFQIRFYLPPIVHADWKKNLIRLLKSTFPDTEEQNFSVISRLFEAYIFEDSASKSPTPREIKLFINDLATMTLMWNRKDKLSYYAAYILTSKLHKNELLTQLRVGRAVSGSFVRILKENPSKVFASYFFNIEDIKKANAMLLKQDVEMDLQKEDHDWNTYDLKDNPALIEILELIIETTLPSWIEDKTDSFFIGVSNLSRLVDQNIKIGDSTIESINHLDEVKKLTILACLDVLQNYFQYFPYDLSKATDAVIDLAKIDNENRTVKSVINSLRKIDAHGNPDLNQGLHVYPLTAEKTDILSSLKKLYSENRFKIVFDQLKNNSIKIHISILDWLEFCMERSTNDNLLRVLHPSSLSGVNTNDEKMIGLLANVDYEKRFFHFIKRELRFSTDQKIIELILSKIESLIRIMESEPSMMSGRLEQSSIILRDLLFLTLNGNSQAEKLLLSIGNSKFIYKLLSRASQSSRESKSFPSFILTFLIAGKTYDPDILDSEYTQAHNYIDSIFKQRKYLKQLDDLVRFISSYELDKIYKYKNFINGPYSTLIIEHSKIR